METTRTRPPIEQRRPVGERSRTGVDEVAARAGAVSPSMRVAYLLSAIVVVLATVASVLGLVVDDLYRGDPWGVEAFRGGDLVTLLVAMPVLAASIVFARRGSARATAVWIGMLGYCVYDFAFYAYQPVFNDVFLPHLAILALSIQALALALAGVDRTTVGEALRNDRVARWVGALLVAVGAGQGALWIALIVRNAVTGELLADLPADGQHLVFALDLTLMMPALVVAGVLLFRRRAVGYLLATAASVLGAVYTLNGMAARWFQADAGVPGVGSPVSIDGALLVLAMAVPAVVLVTGRPRARGRGPGAAA
jgi:hypothetical protein